MFKFSKDADQIRIKLNMSCPCTIGEEWTEDGQEYRYSQAFKKRAKNVEGKGAEAVEESTSEEEDDSDDLDSIDEDEEEEELDYSKMSTECSSITYLDDGRALVKYYLPWAEVVVDFHDRVKNLTSG